jgi:hypothetical protein
LITELVNLKNVDFEYLLEKLIFESFEVKTNFNLIMNNKLKKIISISATANRADNLSVKRSVKEIAALIHKSLKYLSS